MKINDLTQDYLKSLLVYDPETGGFTNKVTRGRRSKEGHATGCLNKSHGYVYIKIGGVCYKSHRLAWLYMTGNWPIAQIDHIDRDRANNRWHNLREATNAKNSLNKGLNKNSTSGLTGVHKRKDSGKYRAYITVNGKRINLGSWDTPEQAATAYKEAKAKMHVFAL